MINYKRLDKVVCLMVLIYVYSLLGMATISARSSECNHIAFKTTAELIKCQKEASFGLL